MNPPENLPSFRRIQDLAEKNSQDLQNVLRLPTALQEIAASARQRQLEMQQATELVRGRSTAVLDTARKAFEVMETQRLEIHALEQRCASVRDLVEHSTRNFHDLGRLPKYWQEMAENSTLQQALRQAPAWDLGGLSSLETAARAAQCGRGLQSQMEQATALARSVRGDQAHTPFVPGGLMSQALTYLPDRTSSRAFRFMGPEDREKLAPSEAQIQTERHEELLILLRALAHQRAPQAPLQTEHLPPAPVPDPTPPRASHETMGTALYQAGMTLLNEHKPLKLSGIARELTLSLTQLKENLKPYPGLWISVRRQVRKDHKNKP